jgi:hypothetical protein
MQVGQAVARGVMREHRLHGVNNDSQ